MVVEASPLISAEYAEEAIRLFGAGASKIIVEGRGTHYFRNTARSFLILVPNANPAFSRWALS